MAPAAFWACACASKAGRSRDCPTLFVANHVSYLDVLILGAFLDATFIAKAEIAGWPLFGLLAQAVPHVLHPPPLARRADPAQRRWPPGCAPARASSCSREGTSTNGLAVRRFKTTLLSVAEPWVLDCPVAVQAVTLAYWQPRRRHPDRARQLRSLRLARRRRPPAASVAGAASGGGRGRPGRPPERPVLVGQSRKALGSELQWQVAEELARRCGHDCEPLCAPAAGTPPGSGLSGARTEKKEACASFSDRTCVCGLAPRYEPHLNLTKNSRQAPELVETS